MGPARERQAAVAHRLRRIEGQVRGVGPMLEQGRDGPQVLIQLSAVRGAVDEVERLVRREHVRDCLTRAARPASQAERQHWIDEIVHVVMGAPTR